MTLRFYIRTFGCQMNKNDSSIISHLLTIAGMEEVDNTDHADIVIINTCSVREHAEQRAIGHIATLRSWRHQGGRMLAVVGCMAQRCVSWLMAEYPFIDIVLGPDSYRSIVHHINHVMNRHTRIRETDFHQELYSGLYPEPRGISDFISIMRGCNNFCSYCIVPFVRGPARSRPAPDIIAQVSYLVEHGVKDITLLGQNVNEYKHAAVDFAGLLEQVSHVPGVCRVRFLTSHPKDLDNRTIDTIARNPALCEWFHLPLQSGNDRILALMNRHYTIEQYQHLINRIRSVIPHATITTDIIVGYPSETGQEFDATLAFVKAFQFDDAYMYGYSTRPGTAAACCDCLPEPVIRERLHDLIALQNEIIIRKTRAMIGHTYEVLFEGAARRGGVRGKTRGNKDVIVMSGADPGSVMNTEIRSINGRTLIGTIVP
jgi:tRNA-2-methylthio-N6-dimethylallyladenosine synthase